MMLMRWMQLALSQTLPSVTSRYCIKCLKRSNSFWRRWYSATLSLVFIMLEKNSGISKDGGYFFGAICCNLRTWQNFTMSHRPSLVFHTEHPTLCTTQWARHEALCSFSIPCTSSFIPSLPSHLNPAKGILGSTVQITAVKPPLCFWRESRGVIRTVFWPWGRLPP